MFLELVVFSELDVFLVDWLFRVGWSGWFRVEVFIVKVLRFQLKFLFFLVFLMVGTF